VIKKHANSKEWFFFLFIMSYTKKGDDVYGKRLPVRPESSFTNFPVAFDLPVFDDTFCLLGGASFDVFVKFLTTAFLTRVMMA